jgi:hypothetical protein
VVRTACRGLRLCLWVIAIFIFESRARGKDMLNGFENMFVSDCDIIF